VLGILESWQAWLLAGGAVVGVVLIALGLHTLVFSVAQRMAGRTGTTVDNAIIRHSKRPARAILPLLAVYLVLPVFPLTSGVLAVVQHAIGLGLIGCAAWLAIALIQVLEDVLAARYRIDVQDNLRARKIQTQVQVLRRIAATAIIVLTVSLALMTFPSIRNLGASLFASAGLAGLIVGLAARPALSNVIAGLQIALTEPIRIEDAVIVEGEWGWIEEIETTYVVVRIWDLRRLIVPLSYFIEKPFQNWTRRTADLLGSVFIYVDYSVPVEAVRDELQRILGSSGLWDGKVWNLQVTNASEHTVELRALMSAADSGKAWDLRCHVREKLIAFLQARYPECLPRVRAEIRGAAGG
jgi:small-conductance mechanosensitive channel